MLSKKKYNLQLKEYKLNKVWLKDNGHFKFNFKVVFLTLTIFFLTLMSLQITSAAYARTSPAYTQTTFFNPTQNIDFSSFLFNREMCQAGQDFILQVDPRGCSPSVVRSDLL